MPEIFHKQHLFVSCIVSGDLAVGMSHLSLTQNTYSMGISFAKISSQSHLLMNLFLIAFLLISLNFGVYLGLLYINNR